MVLGAVTHTLTHACFSVTGRAGFYEPMGLIGIATFDDSIELVKVHPASGALESIALLFDEAFEGLLSGSVSALSEERGAYYFVAHGRYVCACMLCVRAQLHIHKEIHILPVA
jgi:hypothetical protein